MVELDLLTQLGSLIKHDHRNEPEFNCGCFSSRLSCLGVVAVAQSRAIFLNDLFLRRRYVHVEGEKSHGVEAWLNVVARLLCRFRGVGAAWSAPVCTSPAQLIWGSREGWLNTANGPHKHWEGAAPAYHWCCPIWLQGPRENVVGLGEGIVDHGPGFPVSRLIVAEKGEWGETEKRL